MRCYLCTYFFNSSLRCLITHWRTFHSLDNSSIYECTVSGCERRFSSLNSFKRHFQLQHASYFSLVQNETTFVKNIDTSSDIHDDLNLQFDGSIQSSGDNCTNDPKNGNDSPCILSNDLLEQSNDSSIPNSSGAHISETNFSTIFRFQFQRMITSFYSKPSIPRNIVQCIIDEFENFISCPLTILQNTVKEILIRNSVPLDQQQEINSMFQVFPLVLKENSSEYLRFKNLEEAGLFIHFFSHTIGEEFEAKHGREVPKKRDVQIVPLREVLKAFLETGDVLDCILQYMSCLDTHISILSNIMHYEDHKKSGNRVAFAKLIDELNYLAEEGILVETKTKKLQVYFILSVIEGDNLGLNTILGYNQSFSANSYCRICEVSKTDAQYATVADNTALRTEINYEADVKSNDSKSTGIKEDCVFNKVRYYHCVRNVGVDIMHDLPEGVLAYETGSTFHQLILVDKLIDLNHFNSIVRNFDYQFQTCTPPTVTTEQLNSKFLKMSASEMLTFFTYGMLLFSYYVRSFCTTR